MKPAGNHAFARWPPSTNRRQPWLTHPATTGKQGNHLVRWAAIEAVARYHGGEVIAPAFRRIAGRRGKMIARVAAARTLLTLVYYGLRDGQIRCLDRGAA
jgi:hypothetical protein